MLTVDTLIAVLSLCLTSFGLGYAIGSNGSKTTKNNRPSLELNGYFNLVNDQANRCYR